MRATMINPRVERTKLARARVHYGHKSGNLLARNFSRNLDGDTVYRLVSG